GHPVETALHPDLLDGRRGLRIVEAGGGEVDAVAVGGVLEGDLRPATAAEGAHGMLRGGIADRLSREAQRALADGEPRHRGRARGPAAQLAMAEGALERLVGRLVAHASAMAAAGQHVSTPAPWARCTRCRSTSCSCAPAGSRSSPLRPG